MDKQEFLKLLAANYQRINSYIFCMVPNQADSEDIMQETIILMWEKFDQYVPDSNFIAWALTIAKFKILSYLRDASRSKVHFDDSVVEMIESTSMSKQNNENMSDKIAAIKKCIEKLPVNERKIIQLKFSRGLDNNKLSKSLGISTATIYRRLSKIYLSLLVCINRSLNVEEI